MTAPTTVLTIPAEVVGLSYADAGALVNVSAKTIERAVKAGDLPARRVGVSIVRIKPADLQAWFDGLPDFEA